MSTSGVYISRRQLTYMAHGPMTRCTIMRFRATQIRVSGCTRWHRGTNSGTRVPKLPHGSLTGHGPEKDAMSMRRAGLRWMERVEERKLCENVGKHVLGRAADDKDGTKFPEVADVEIVGVDVLGF